MFWRGYDPFLLDANAHVACKNTREKGVLSEGFMTTASNWSAWNIHAGRKENMRSFRDTFIGQ